MLEAFIRKMRRRGFRYAVVEQYSDGTWGVEFRADDLPFAPAECSGEGKTLAKAIAAVENDWRNTRGK